jgi:tetratricopeptide (TPR) repeat protein
MFNYTEQARKLYIQGKDLATNREYKAALKKYFVAIEFIKKAENMAISSGEQTRMRHSRATFLYIIARTYQLDKQYVFALRYYRLCLEANPLPKVAQLSKKEIDVLLPLVQVTLVIDSIPKQASISITNEQGESRLAKTPFVSRLEPGRILVQISHSGYQPHREWLTLTIGSRIERVYQLQEKKTKTTLTPPAHRPQPLPKIKHTLPYPTAPSLASQIVAWTSIGMAVAGAVSSGVFFGMSYAQYNEARSMKGNALYSTQQVIETVGKGDTFQIIAWISLAVTGVCTTIAVLLYLPRRTTSEQSVYNIKPQHPHSPRKIGLYKGHNTFVILDY